MSLNRFGLDDISDLKIIDKLHSFLHRDNFINTKALIFA